MELVWPVLAQVLLTLVVLGLLGRARVRAVKAGAVRIKDIAVSSDGWPDDVRKVANNFANQFETPVLFYVLCGLAMSQGITGWPMVALAWIFVASRIAHAVVHTGRNVVMLRFRIFLVGVGALTAMWALLAAALIMR